MSFASLSMRLIAASYVAGHASGGKTVVLLAMVVIAGGRWAKSAKVSAGDGHLSQKARHPTVTPKSFP